MCNWTGYGTTEGLGGGTVGVVKDAQAWTVVHSVRRIVEVAPGVTDALTVVHW